MVNINTTRRTMTTTPFHFQGEEELKPKPFLLQARNDNRRRSVQKCGQDENYAAC